MHLSNGKKCHCLSSVEILLHILQEKQDSALFRTEWKSLRAPGMAANGKWAEKKLIICLPLSLAAIIMFTMPSHHLWELRRADERVVPPCAAADVAVLKDSYDLCLSDQASCYSANSHINLLSDLTETQSVWQIHSQRMPGILLFALDRCLRIKIPPVEWRYTGKNLTSGLFFGLSSLLIGRIRKHVDALETLESTSLSAV